MTFFVNKIHMSQDYLSLLGCKLHSLLLKSNEIIEKIETTD